MAATKEVGLANGLLALGGVASIALSLSAFNGHWYSPIGVAAGAGAVAAAAKIDRRYQLELSDYFGGSQLAFDALNEVFSGTSDEARKRLKVLVQYLPEKYRSFAEVAALRLLEDDWIKDFVRRSKAVIGVTRSGKTKYMLLEVARFFEDYPEGRLIIADINYKKPDEDGYVNDWYGLPKERFVRYTYGQVKDAVDEVWNELQDRKQHCINSTQKQIKFQRVKLLIDEFIGVNSSAKSAKEDDDLHSKIGDIVYQGLGYQIEITIGLQTQYVGQSGLSLALFDQLNYLFLGASATEKRNFQNLAGVRDSELLVSTLEKTRKIPNCKYAGIARIGSDPAAVKVVPYFDEKQVDLCIAADTQTDDDIAWSNFYTDEVAADIKAIASGDISKTEFCKKHSVIQRRTDPIYSRVLAAVDREIQALNN